MKELELKVEGMVCGGCEKRVVNSLSTLEGVNEVSANHQTGTVLVKMTEDIDIEVLKEKIEDLGFEVK
ncbi:MAG: heavy-metal-associated domain-containing protein [Clostridia bacterium]|jgi:copper chaperone CopZ|nr:heavy-metal-associated domain-containing protein [Clostridia bacterium]